MLSKAFSLFWVLSFLRNELYSKRGIFFVPGACESWLLVGNNEVGLHKGLGFRGRGLGVEAFGFQV